MSMKNYNEDRKSLLDELKDMVEDHVKDCLDTLSIREKRKFRKIIDAIKKWRKEV